MPTILVTGGAGFIGGNFVRSVLRQPDVQIVNLDKLTYAGNLDSLQDLLAHPRHEFVEGDIRDQALISELLSKHAVDGVVHFAAESHVDRSIDGPAEFVDTNVVGTFRMLQASLGYWKSLPEGRKSAFRFLHVSTDEVYGSLGPTGYFTPESQYAPNSPYSASKAASDHFVRAYHHTFGLPVVTTNCSNNYGPFQFPEKLIPLMILNCLEGKPLPVYGDGQQIRDWLFVGDHCSAIWKVLQAGRVGEVYTIGGNSEKANLQVVHTICDLVDEACPNLPHGKCRSLITYVQDRPGHDRRYAIDASKIKNELGWEPSLSFEAGLRQTVRWYLDNRGWVERVSSGAYQRERLGLVAH